MYVYGSAARGDATPLSDIDVAVLFIENVTERRRREILAEVAGQVARQRAGSELDVRDLEDLPLTIQGRVLAEGTLAHSNDEVRRVRIETYIRMRYFDFLPFHRRDVKEGLDSLRRKFNG